MKFKTIFALFNIVLVLSFTFILVMPFFLLGAEYSLTFWSRNWPLIIFFVIVLSGFNAFFALNWRLFSALEAEDWKAVTSLLSDRVLRQHKHDRRTIRLLVNTALLKGDVELVQKIEQELRERRPAALRRDAVLFGVALLLRNDPEASERFLAPFLDGHGVDNAKWLGFYHAFSLVMQKRAYEAVALLQPYLDADDPVLSLLSAYLTGTLCASAVDEGRREELLSAAQRIRTQLSKRYTAVHWARESERAKGEMHIVILSKILDDASVWLFG
ncbi:MAG: hypothetical protein A3J97_03970 [Spirochaetes bacterium RIFOXYC1_FULL_54_7]|nr:MAG: hypothetical protein A3J97_03970 [Spirochaetes bacterium RIFOXYC1_FULL_54_7]